MYWRHVFTSLFCLSPAVLCSGPVSNDTELRTDILANDTSITFQNNITLTGSITPNLPAVNALNTFAPATPGAPIIIDGLGRTLSGGNAFRGFFLREGTESVTIQNLTFDSCLGVGGNGSTVGANSSGGGGGGGLGGALFIEGTATLTNVSFINNEARGGNGGISTGGTTQGSGAGGGGFRGDGGGGNMIPSTGGGGFSGAGGSATFLQQGQSGTGGGGLANAPNTVGNGPNRGGHNLAGTNGGAGGGNSANGSGGGTGGGGGGGGSNTAGGTNNIGGSGGIGGYGGGGGAGSPAINNLTTTTGNGAMGGEYGGGGGGGAAHDYNPISPPPLPTNGGDGGAGGFSGGGGAGGFHRRTDPTSGQRSGNGGNGGFGGGGGGAGNVFNSGSTNTLGTAGLGGYGGGDGGAGSSGINIVGAFGGGGAGFGGALFLKDTAVVTLSGTLSFENNILNGGTGANAGLTDGADIFMMSGSEIFFNLSQDLILENPIAGNQGRLTATTSTGTTGGGLHKQGTHLLALTGDNTYTGMTWVEGGELRVSSSLITDVTVNSGARFTGNAEIKQDINGNGGNLINNGIVSPGVNGVGIITLDGDYEQGASGLLIVDITPDGQSDQIQRSAINTLGTAMLAGNLEVVVNAGNYIDGTTYTIIDAPVMGTFNEPLILSGVNADAVQISISYSSVVLTVMSSLIFENQNINPGVATAVANCFREATIIPGSDFAIITEILGTLNDRDVNAALVGLSPVRFGALEWINERNNSYVADLLSQHLFELCCSPRDCCSCDCNASFWVNAFGNVMQNTKWLDNLRPFDANAVGALAGADFCCGPCFYYGVSVGYTHTHLIWKDQGGKGNLDSYYGALYGSWHCDCFSVDLSAIGGGTDQELRRRNVFSTIDRVAKSDFWSYFATGHLGLRTQWDWCGTTFEPFALGDYHYYTRDHFKEKGADSINLKVYSHDQNFIRGEAGLRAYSQFQSDCYCFAPYIGLSWVGEFPLGASKQKASFIDQDCVMNVKSYDSSAQLASPQVGFKWTCCDGASFVLGYKGLFNNKTHINQMESRFEWIF